jgi:hypothetical protein
MIFCILGKNIPLYKYIKKYIYICIENIEKFKKNDLKQKVFDKSTNKNTTKMSEINQ